MPGGGRVVSICEKDFVLNGAFVATSLSGVHGQLNQSNDEDMDREEEGMVLPTTRTDGRALLAYRPIHALETSVVAQASGSCRLLLQGGTEILVGVRPSPSQRSSHQPKLGFYAGSIVTHIQFAPSVAAAMGIAHSKQQEEALCNQYIQFLDQLLNTRGGLNLPALCIVPGDAVWVLNVDVLVLNFGGNVLDAISIAIRAALMNTCLPVVTLERVSESKSVYTIGDEESQSLAGCNNIPIAVTLSMLGHNYVLDATPAEEVCSHFSLVCGVNCVADQVPKASLLSILKMGSGGIESSLLPEMITTALEVGSEMIQVTDCAIASRSGNTPLPSETLVRMMTKSR